MKFGDLPKSLGIQKIECKEMMAYLYLPIKLANQETFRIEKRVLENFYSLIVDCIIDFKTEFGKHEFEASYIYLTIKHLFVSPGCDANRPGWHSDGFLTDDINYIWSSNHPTIFNHSDFNLTPDHI